ILFTGAGPAVSLVLGAALLLLSGAGPAGFEGRPIVTAFGMMSLAIGLVSLLPLPGGITDGAKVMVLARAGPRSDRVIAQTVLLTPASSGTRPRDWSPLLVDQAIGPDDASVDAMMGRLLASAHHQDAGR